jgi:hypothetical protein
VCHLTCATHFIQTPLRVHFSFISIPLRRLCFHTHPSSHWVRVVFFFFFFRVFDPPTACHRKCLRSQPFFAISDGPDSCVAHLCTSDNMCRCIFEISTTIGAQLEPPSVSFSSSSVRFRVCVVWCVCVCVIFSWIFSLPPHATESAFDLNHSAQS